MSNDYKLGYQNGRYEALQELQKMLRKRNEPLFQKILNRKKVNKYDDGLIDAFNAVETWRIEKMEELEDD